MHCQTLTTFMLALLILAFIVLVSRARHVTELKKILAARNQQLDAAELQLTQYKSATRHALKDLYRATSVLDVAQANAKENT